MRRTFVILLFLLFLGACSMPRDYPDWMAGFDTQEGARRQVQGAGASETGLVLWSSSFEEGLSEWIIDAAEGGSVAVMGNDAYRGGTSARITTLAVTDDTKSLLQFVRPLKTGKIGVEVFLKPMTYALSGSQTVSVVLYVSNPDWTLGYCSADLQIRNDGTTHGAVWVLGGLGSYVDTGIRVGSFFINEGLGYYLLSWHQFKLVLDADNSDPLYAYYDKLIYDGKEYDLSAYATIRGDPTGLPYGILAGVRLTTDEMVAHSVNVDQMTVTYDEP
jgi:hypothetical protein